PRSSSWRPAIRPPVAAARAPQAAKPPRRRAWLRIFAVRCSLPCDPPVGGHSCNGGSYHASIARSGTKADGQIERMLPNEPLGSTAVRLRFPGLRCAAIVSNYAFSKAPRPAPKGVTKTGRDLSSAVLFGRRPGLSLSHCVANRRQATSSQIRQGADRDLCRRSPNSLLRPHIGGWS